MLGRVIQDKDIYKYFCLIILIKANPKRQNVISTLIVWINPDGVKCKHLLCIF